MGSESGADEGTSPVRRTRNERRTHADARSGAESGEGGESGDGAAGEDEEDDEAPPAKRGRKSAKPDLAELTPEQLEARALAALDKKKV
jgi:hypothetical protein